MPSQQLMPPFLPHVKKRITLSRAHATYAWCERRSPAEPSDAVTPPRFAGLTN